jgi:flagellar biosynthesis protein FlhF
VPATAPATAPAAAPTGAASGGESAGLRAELRALRSLLEQQFAALAWNDYTRREPLRARALGELVRIGLTREAALQVLESWPTELAPEQALHVHYALLARSLREQGAPLEAGGVVALLGAPGSGRTTTLARLALRWLAEHAPETLTLVTIDDEHVGAAEQAQALGRLLGVECLHYPDIDSFRAGLTAPRAGELLLLDLPALASDDDENARNAAALLREGLGARCLLMLPASSQAGVLAGTLRRASAFAPVAAVLTRCDEAQSLGAALSALVQGTLPVAFCSDGARITDELKAARGPALVARAVELARISGETVDQERLAAEYGSELHVAA